MTFTRRFIAVTAIAVVLITAGAAVFLIVKKPVSRLSPSVSGLSLRDFAFKGIDGNTITLSSLYGRPVVLDAWTSWCLFCAKHIADFAVLQKEFGDKLLIVEVNRGESLEIVKNYSGEVDGSHTLLFVLDADDSLYKDINGFSMPETLFIDKEGTIVDHIRGPMDIIEMRRHIQDSFAL